MPKKPKNPPPPPFVPPPPPAPQTQPPAAAQGVGYNTLTFSSGFTAADYATKWHLWNFFGGKADPNKVKLNADGSATLLGDVTGPNGQIATVTPGGTSGFTGVAFGGGGYFEATLCFDPAVVNLANGWPSWWSMALEHLVFLPGVQWPGQVSNYEHFIEADFFEFDLNSPTAYGGVLHDWYGVYNAAAGGYKNLYPAYPAFVRTVPAGTDFKEYHRYGFLWIPATDSTEGSASFYFDGQSVGAPTTWSKFTGQPPPPDGQPWAYGIIDLDHLALILGSGVNQPMAVSNVSVWQTSATSNMTG